VMNTRSASSPFAWCTATHRHAGSH
jgi:hypothetical protein